MMTRLSTGRSSKRESDLARSVNGAWLTDTTLISWHFPAIHSWFPLLTTMSLRPLGQIVERISRPFMELILILSLPVVREHERLLLGSKITTKGYCLLVTSDLAMSFQSFGNIRLLFDTTRNNGYFWIT